MCEVLLHVCPLCHPKLRNLRCFSFLLQLYKMYTSGDPPPVELIRTPQFLGERFCFTMMRARLYQAFTLRLQNFDCLTFHFRTAHFNFVQTWDKNKQRTSPKVCPHFGIRVVRVRNIQKGERCTDTVRFLPRNCREQTEFSLVTNLIFPVFRA